MVAATLEVVRRMDDDWHLKVIGTRANGSREFDPAKKEQLITECLRPGISVAGLALRAGVNANLLRKWVDERKKLLGMGRKAASTAAPMAKPAAFIPVVPAAPVREHTETIDWDPGPSEVSTGGQIAPRPATQETAPLPCVVGGPATKVSATLPNGVTLMLECSDAQMMVTIIGALSDVPPGA
jgi:transposase